MLSYLNLSNLTDTIISYDEVINEIYNIILSVEKAKEGMTKEKWDGEGREAFIETLEKWLTNNKMLLLSIIETRNNLNGFLAQDGEDIKKYCESFINNFDY